VEPRGVEPPTSRVRCLSRCPKATGSSRKERKHRATRPSLSAAFGGLPAGVHRQNTDIRPLAKAGLNSPKMSPLQDSESADLTPGAAAARRTGPFC
jgi:hypothetical protein